MSLHSDYQHRQQDRPPPQWCAVSSLSTTVYFGDRLANESYCRPHHDHTELGTKLAFSINRHLIYGYNERTSMELTMIFPEEELHEKAHIDYDRVAIVRYPNLWGRRVCHCCSLY